MIETKIKWHKASEELPDKSCMVITAHANGDRIYRIISVNFSARHKLFNYYDFMDCPNPDNSEYSETIKYWAYFDELAKSLEDKEKTAENGNSQTVKENIT